MGEAGGEASGSRNTEFAEVRRGKQFQMVGGRGAEGKAKAGETEVLEFGEIQLPTNHNEDLHG